jgi:integrase
MQDLFMASPNALKGEIVRIQKGVAIYQVNASPYWYARIRDPSTRRHIVRSTKETSQLRARKVAEELYLSVIRNCPLAVPKDRTLGYFADELISLEKLKGERGELHKRLWANTSFYLHHKVWGVTQRFNKVDIGTITTTDYIGYLEWVRTKDNALKPATMNHLSSAFSKVLKLARDRGALITVPDLPRTSRQDNPRPYFRFHPLVAKEDDEYKKLLDTAKQMADEEVRVRETIVTEELHDMIMFLVHSFVRPIETEFYALKHKHVSIIDDPRGLLLTIADGKTGFRLSNTMPAAVTVYEKIKKRNPDMSRPEDYLFFPQYKNRSSAKRIAQRLFNALLKRCTLKENPIFEYKHSLYSLRHTAICMRLTLSKGRVNIYSLAKNAGTSVNQIERFYARNLPLSAELVRNLQSFGASS